MAQNICNKTITLHSMEHCEEYTMSCCRGNPHIGYKLEKQRNNELELKSEKFLAMPSNNEYRENGMRQ